MFSHIFVWCHSPPCHQKNLFRKTELSPSAGSSSWFCKFADQLVWIPSKNSIWLLQDASKLETPLPPKKKNNAPGGLQAWQNDGRFETKGFRILPEKISYSFREKQSSYLVRRWVFVLLLPEQRAPGITSDQGTGCASCRFPKQNLSHCLKKAVAVVICWIFLGKLPGIFVADPWDPQFGATRNIAPEKSWLCTLVSGYPNRQTDSIVNPGLYESCKYTYRYISNPSLKELHY